MILLLLQLLLLVLFRLAFYLSISFYSSPYCLLLHPPPFLSKYLFHRLMCPSLSPELRRRRPLALNIDQGRKHAHVEVYIECSLRLHLFATLFLRGRGRCMFLVLLLCLGFWQPYLACCGGGEASLLPSLLNASLFLLSRRWTLLKVLMTAAATIRGPLLH